jgi:cytochrome c-type biogenesis protein CcmH
VTVTVSVDPAFENTVSADDTVFVIARTAEGQGPPLAGVRLRAGELPADVTLSDDNAMLEGHRLSGHEQVEVVARISRSGEATPRSGDLTGSRLVAVGQVNGEPPSIRIDKRLD